MKKKSLMEELLTGHEFKGLQRGSIVNAKIVSISNRQVFLDLGGKSEGIVEGREYDAARDFIKSLKVGDTVSATVIIPETRAGLTLVSLRGVALDASWKKLEEAVNSLDALWVVVKGITKGGLQVDFSGVEGFIPMSQLGELVSGHPQDFVGRSLQVRLIDADRERGRVLFSEREVSEKDKIEKQKQVVSSLVVGEVYEGEVASVFPFGVFVRILKDSIPIEGLLHSTRISQALGKLDVGSRIRVTVVRAEDGKVSFDLGADISKYEKDLAVLGRVVRVTRHLATVELEPGVIGVSAVNALPPGTTIRAGETRDFFVESVDPVKRKITLGLVLKAKPVGYK